MTIRDSAEDSAAAAGDVLELCKMVNNSPFEIFLSWVVVAPLPPLSLLSVVGWYHVARFHFRQNNSSVTQFLTGKDKGRSRKRCSEGRIEGGGDWGSMDERQNQVCTEGMGLVRLWKDGLVLCRFWCKLLVGASLAGAAVKLAGLNATPTSSTSTARNNIDDWWKYQFNEATLFSKPIICFNLMACIDRNMVSEPHRFDVCSSESSSRRCYPVPLDFGPTLL